MNQYVYHYVVECEYVRDECLEHMFLIHALEALCNKFDLNVINKTSHKFEPHGSSVVFILSESHIALHSWPEHNYIHIDMVTCSKIKQTKEEVVLIAQEIFNTNSIKFHELFSVYEKLSK